MPPIGQRERDGGSTEACGGSSFKLATKSVASRVSIALAAEAGRTVVAFYDSVNRLPVRVPSPVRVGSYDPSEASLDLLYDPVRERPSSLKPAWLRAFRSVTCLEAPRSGAPPRARESPVSEPRSASFPAPGRSRAHGSERGCPCPDRRCSHRGLDDRGRRSELPGKRTLRSSHERRPAPPARHPRRAGLAAAQCRGLRAFVGADVGGGAGVAGGAVDVVAGVVGGVAFVAEDAGGGEGVGAGDGGEVKLLR